MSISTRRPTRKPAAKAAPILPPGLTLSKGSTMNRIYQAPELQINGVTVVPSYQIEDPDAPANLTDADVTALIAWAVKAALTAVTPIIVGAMPKDHPAVLKHVLRDPDGKITTVIEENATLRTVQ
jgi:hypothetical protein